MSTMTAKAHIAQQHNPTPPNDSDDHLNVPVRPPPRPFKRANLSLEQNPFEVSFSQSSSSNVPSSSNQNSNANSNHNGSSNEQQQQSSSDQMTSPKDSPKPTLPPLSAIAEPVQESASTGFPWAFTSGLNDPSSLRSGPLSPAMLPGPRQGQDPNASAANANATTGYFDAPSLSFRTGLTPGIGRTGLTPLVGGPASFPPPSPNTAAFLAMVTNPQNGSQNGNSHQGGGTVGAGGNPSGSHPNMATITPNTLSALTGTLLPPPPSTQSHSHDYSNSYNTNNGNNNQQPYRNGDSFAGAAQNAAAAAANGLFLLSQAHQELTKREEQQQQQQQAAAAESARIATRRSAANANTNINTTIANGHNKRKSGDPASPVQTTKPGTGKRAKAAATPTRTSSRRRKSDVTLMGAPEVNSPDDLGLGMDEDIDSMDEDDMNGMAIDGSRSSGKKFETEEEKRKNFLERNRMAALKCRQRKKAWLNQLQQQVEFLKTENERLQGTIVSMRDEVTRLSAVVVAHRSCGLGGIVVPSFAENAVGGSNNANGNGGRGGNGNGASPSASPVVGIAPVSVPVKIAGEGTREGYGY